MSGSSCSWPLRNIPLVQQTSPSATGTTRTTGSTRCVSSQSLLTHRRGAFSSRRFVLRACAHENLSETQTFAMTTRRRRNASVDVIRQSELPPWRWSCDQCLTPWTHSSPTYSSSSSIGTPLLKTVPKADRCWRNAAEKVRAASLVATSHPVATHERQKLL